ncbi:MAG TPA: hypothetical protein VET66_14255 [Steroidobacteraceae bacterium]|nr:hypothetical protein [Steroidobacteraceae bacterium]
MRSGGTRRARAALAAGLAAGAVAYAAVDPGALTQAERAARTGDDGIWKAVVPPRSMHGEFDSNDPIGVAAGRRIAADCSINWLDPDEHKLYCFSSATSLVFFLEGPHGWLERARRQWPRLAAR